MMCRPLHAIYGGAFDPVHEGHLAVARAARDRLDARIALVPTGDPPHRSPARAAAEHRLAMLRLALDGEPGLQVDAREIERQGPSYSVDTLAQLRAGLGPHTALAMIVGADAFAGLPGWHRWTELFDLAHIIVASRPDTGAISGELAGQLQRRLTTAVADLHAEPAGRVWQLALEPYRHSSSAIRARVAAGQSLQGWVPQEVVEYIIRHGLYRDIPQRNPELDAGSV